MLTAAGSGYSRWQNVAVTRWPGRCHAGLLGDVHLSPRRAKWKRVVSEVSSPSAQVCSYEAAFYEDHAEFTTRPVISHPA
jgi:cyclic beta-1,2-glucan synthetase